MSDTQSTMIGGTVCHAIVPPTLIDTEAKALSQADRDGLWALFEAIGRCWGNLPNGSDSVKSSWLEFIQAKIDIEPSYVGEYVNCIAVLRELFDLYGPENAHTLLFFRNGIPPGAPITRLAHAKEYVVNEFIRVQIVAGGFKGFGNHTGRNYKGYIGGSRYNRIERVRAWHPERARDEE